MVVAGELLLHCMTVSTEGIGGGLALLAWQWEWGHLHGGCSGGSYGSGEVREG